MRDHGALRTSRLGLLVAPASVVPASALHLWLWHWSPGAAAGALYVALVALPLSYSLTWLVGLPWLALVQRLDLPRLPGLAGGGLAAGTGVGALVALALFPAWDAYARAFYLSLGALCGLSVGVSYWLLARLTRALR